MRAPEKGARRPDPAAAPDLAALADLEARVAALEARAVAAAAALGVTRQTAHRHLRELVAEGHLVAEGAGRGARYLTEVFAEYTRDFEFTRTRMVIRLFAIGTEFVSRSHRGRARQIATAVTI